ncbi:MULTISPECIES: CAP domain-containing protein [Marinobacter]|uniref:CAP domain-containing protein n=1 Tax=Marinobacter TaxID=2742 RepID=UPI001246D573|nr:MULTISPECIES: CAP domain-containing protein [Marinobacter]MBL3555293.1 CAP domain-containing protein [Marinobacter sp. JB05H06]
MARQTRPNAFALLGLLGFSGFLVAGECEMDETDRALLDRVNEARSQPRQCGDEHFDAAEPLAWNCKLEEAALAHSEDMVGQEFFSHTGPEGVQMGERVLGSGYSWSAVGENIAGGQNSVDAVVDGWLSSPGHCANIMSTKFTEMGAAKAEERGSRYSPSWTQIFGRPSP